MKVKHPGGAAGYSWWGGIAMFGSQNNDTTAAHEVVHSVGIAHTFANIEADAAAHITYEAKKTDNIIDYAHLEGTGTRRSTYRWQWAIMNATVTASGAVLKSTHTHIHD